MEKCEIILKLSQNIYILCAFSKERYNKPVDCNVVYISIITSSHMTLSDVKINHGPLQRRHDVNDAVPLFVIKLRVNVFMGRF